VDGGGGGHEHDGHAYDGRPEDVVRELVVRQPDKPHERLVIVHVVDRQAALRGRHAGDTGVHRLRQPGTVQSVARAEQTDGHDEDVRRVRRGPAPPVLPLAAPHFRSAASHRRRYDVSDWYTCSTGCGYTNTHTHTHTHSNGETERLPHDEVRRGRWRSKKQNASAEYNYIILYQPMFVDFNVIYGYLQSLVARLPATCCHTAHRV